jgi:hypothetical protein
MADPHMSRGTVCTLLLRLEFFISVVVQVVLIL